MDRSARREIDRERSESEKFRDIAIEIRDRHNLQCGGVMDIDGHIV
jgi:hypothetical protein